MNFNFNWLDEQAKIFPTDKAIIAGKNEFTFSSLNVNAAVIAQTLSEKGVTSESRVAVLSDNNSDFISLIFAIWKLKAVPVLLNVKLLNAEIADIINFCSPNFIFVHKELSSFFIEDKETIIFPFNHLSTGETVKFDSSLNIDDTALILFTSGTVNKPKGVLLSFRNFLCSSLSANTILKQSSADRWALSLPLYHIGGFSILTRALLSGAALVIPDTLKTDDIASVINNQMPTHISLVPTQLKRLMEAGITPNKELRNVLIGGGPTDDELILTAYSKGWNVNKVYGSTETTAFISALDTKHFSNKYQSVGKPLNDVVIKILYNKDYSDEKKMGEICIKAPMVMKEYLFNKTETENRIKDGFYSTGDIGYTDDDGFLYIETRRTDLIISGGENINPLEVEKKIRGFSKVKDVFVFGLPDEEWGQVVAAVIVAFNNQNFSIDELKNYLFEKLPSYKIPKKIFFTEMLPKTSLGKIKREELLKIIS